MNKEKIKSLRKEIEYLRPLINLLISRKEEAEKELNLLKNDTES